MKDFSMTIKKYDLHRELNLLRFDRSYIEKVIKIVKKDSVYEDNYIRIKVDNKYITYELKCK